MQPDRKLWGHPSASLVQQTPAEWSCWRQVAHSDTETGYFISWWWCEQYSSRLPSMTWSIWTQEGRVSCFPYRLLYLQRADLEYGDRLAVEINQRHLLPWRDTLAFFTCILLPRAVRRGARGAPLLLGKLWKDAIRQNATQKQLIYVVSASLTTPIALKGAWTDNAVVCLFVCFESRDIYTNSYAGDMISFFRKRALWHFCGICFILPIILVTSYFCGMCWWMA